MKNQCVIQIIIMGTGIVVINLDKLPSGIDVFTVDPKKAFDRFELAVRELLEILIGSNSPEDIQSFLG